MVIVVENVGVRGDVRGEGGEGGRGGGRETWEVTAEGAEFSYLERDGTSPVPSTDSPPPRTHKLRTFLHIGASTSSPTSPPSLHFYFSLSTPPQSLSSYSPHLPPFSTDSGGPSRNDRFRERGEGVEREWRESSPLERREGLWM